MELKNFTLALFEESKNPSEIRGIKPIKELGEIHNLVTLFFVDREVKTVSALRIKEYFPINEEMGGVVKGEWDLGVYNEKGTCYHSIGKHPIAGFSPNQTFVTQKRLDEDEVYMEDYLADLFGG